MKILIVNPFGIGDVLFSTPLISNLKEAHPAGFIGYICNNRAKEALSGNSQLNRIFTFEKDQYRTLWKEDKFKCIKEFVSFLVQIRKERFDVAIDLSLGHQYSFSLWLIGVKKRIGYNYRKRGRFLTHKININGYEDKPIVDYYLDLLKFLDIKPKHFNLTMNITKEDRDRADEVFNKNGLKEQDMIIGLIPAGGASWGRDFAYRHWPWENYAKLSDKLIVQLEVKVIILGEPLEENICRQVQNVMQKKAINVCGTTTLKQFAALLAKCDVVVCNDGGPLHVAVSQDVFTVSVFGPVDEKVYGPYPTNLRHIVVTKNISCRPCYKKFKLPACQYDRRCLKGISAEDVFKVIKDNLSKK